MSDKRAFSPVQLSYVAALRGVVPRKPEASFVYVQTGFFDPEVLLCLAASNPQGKFYGLTSDARIAQEGSTQAGIRQVWNATFVQSAELLPAQIDYLCCDAGEDLPSADARATLFALAEKKLVPGGLFAYRYKAYANPDESLRFLIAEYAPELSPAQALEFLMELKDLGGAYFSQHPIAKAALDKAIADKNPESFFETCMNGGQAVSGAFETMAGLLPRDFSAAGDADIGMNYIELATPGAAHAVLDKCRSHLLYEPIKDFATGRLFRNDVWVKRPVEQTAEKPVLFGHFTFGITAPREKIPASLTVGEKTVDLSSPLFQNLINLMCLLPIGIGDFLQHPLGKEYAPDDIVAAIQLLVATGLAAPMRGRFEGRMPQSEDKPDWSTGFNTYFKESEIDSPTVLFASPIVGGPVALSAREALVLQALSRVGLPNISGALQPTLITLSNKNPGLAAMVSESACPTDEAVHNMVTSVLEQGLVRWYAYGLLTAA